jgi:cytochrome b6-f complex iron-sulfur subunit
MAINPYDTPEGRLTTVAETTRRQFLMIMGGLAALAALLLGGIKSLGFIFPNANLEAPADFKLEDNPDSIPVGGVIFRTDKRVTVVRDDGGFYAVYLNCTHLGCTPNYTTDVAGDLDKAQQDRARSRGKRESIKDPLANGWACPCHGSRYFIDSTNFYGPAPRPMDWVQITKATDGKLLVDRAKLVVHRQAGDQTPPTWRLAWPSGKVTGETLGV